jgi:hypothetical protein
MVSAPSTYSRVGLVQVLVGEHSHLSVILKVLMTVVNLLAQVVEQPLQSYMGALA